MRTNIYIDDRLMKAAMAATGKITKKAAVTEALETVVRIARQRKALDALRGMGWEGDLDAMRNDWTEDTDWGLK